MALANAIASVGDVPDRPPPGAVALHLPLGGRGARHRGRGPPGQFVMVRLHEGAERIPLTLADFDAGRARSRWWCRRWAAPRPRCATTTTRATRSPTSVGPLGMPTEIERVGHVVLVGGGLGVAPIFPQLRAFKQAGNRTTAIVGFRSHDLTFWLDELGQWADEVIVCTDDGSMGRQGLVTEALADLIRDDRPDLVVAIGPMVMMRACADTTRASGREDSGVAQHDHGRRHRHVRLVPRHRRRRHPLRLRGGPRLRRPRGGFRRADEPPAALPHRGAGRGHRLRAPLPGGTRAVRPGPAHLQEDPRDRAHPCADDRARSGGEGAHVRRGVARLHPHRGDARGRTLPAVRAAHVHRRLPGLHRHPALHPPPAGARRRRRVGCHQRGQPVPVGLRPRLPAGVAVRGPVRDRPQARARGHRAARAVRGRSRRCRPSRGRRADRQAGRRRRLRPGRPGVRRRPRPQGCRGHGVRSPARRRRGAPLRHPLVPPAARDHRPRGRRRSKPWACASRPTRWWAARSPWPN